MWCVNGENNKTYQYNNNTNKMVDNLLDWVTYNVSLQIGSWYEEQF